MAWRSARTTGAARTVPCVTVGRLIAFAKGVELVRYREHEVAGKVVVTYIVDVVGGNRAGYIAALLQEVVGFYGYCKRFVAQQLI